MEQSAGENGGRVAEHYALDRLRERILRALTDAGLDLDHLTADDLAPLDEFHIRGREATEELAALAGLTPGQRLLDVGCGLGGTARYLALHHGIDVTGVDLTVEYCQVGNLLSERTGLADRVKLIPGNALALPSQDGSFDTVWTEHAAMNIEDKPQLYREMRRVLVPGGRLALHDIISGLGGEVHFPVPWARRPEISFLISAEPLRALLVETGFRVLSWRDVTAPSLAWMRARASAPDAAGSRLGFQVLLGSDAGEMFSNQVRNLEEERIRLVQVVAEAE